MMIVVNGHQHRESSDAYADRNYGKQEAVTCSIRARRHNHAEHEGNSPWRHRVQLSLDRRVPVGLDDRWCEIGIPVCWDDEAKVHQSSEEELVVAETVQDVSESDLAFKSGLSLVLLKSHLDKLSFVFAQPLRILGEIWNNLRQSTIDVR